MISYCTYKRMSLLKVTRNIWTHSILWLLAWNSATTTIIINNNQWCWCKNEHGFSIICGMDEAFNNGLLEMHSSTQEKMSFSPNTLKRSKLSYNIFGRFSKITEKCYMTDPCCSKATSSLSFPNPYNNMQYSLYLTKKK